MLAKALEMGVCLHRVPVLGNMGGRSFPRAFERRVKFLFIRKTVTSNSRDTQKKDLATLSIRASVGEPGGRTFPGTF
jgi:hypothetical protein